MSPLNQNDLAWQAFRYVADEMSGDEVAAFEAVLAAGQSAAVSIPRAAGEAPALIVLSNAGDHLHIAERNAADSAR